MDAHGPAPLPVVLGAGGYVAAVGCVRNVHPRDLPALRAALVARAARPRGWQYDRARNIYTHKATGLMFSGQMVAHYGWDAMRGLCHEITEWRDYLRTLPTTNLVAERERLLEDALNTGDDDEIRRLTRLWQVWWEETDAVMGGNNGR